MKRVTSTDPGTVEDPEQEGNAGGDEGGNAGAGGSESSEGGNAGE